MTEPIQTERLTLRAMTLSEVRAMIANAPAEERAQMSPEWLAKLESSTSADPWVHGYSIILRSTGEIIGKCGFKGPPTPEGWVEIAYGVDPAHRCRGYATETAGALALHAFQMDGVREVRAHTRPEPNASTRALTKSGFRFVGEVIEPEDCLVWRWEKQKPTNHRNQTIRINYVIVLVSDMMRSTAFYRDVIGLSVRFESPDWTEFATEGSTLALHSAEARGTAADDPLQVPAGRCRPGLSVANLDEFHQRMTRHGVTCIQPPKDIFGARVAQYLDPDGLAISVSEERRGR